MTACPPLGCTIQINSPTLRTVGTPFSNVTVDERCEQGVLILTDDPGFNNVEDEGLGVWLNEEERVKTAYSFDDIAAHFKPASSIYKDLQCAFSQAPRATHYVIGHIADGETLSDAFDAVTRCPVCAWQVVVTTYAKNADGTFNAYSGEAPLFSDTTEYLDLAKKLNAMRSDWYMPYGTAEASLAFGTPFETTSYSYQYASAGGKSSTALYSYACDVQRDADFVAVLDDDSEQIPVSVYNNSALSSANLAAGYSTSSPSYNWTKYDKPTSGSYGCENGLFLDETTGEQYLIDQSSLYSLTGIDASGSKISGATRHNSAFFPVKNYGSRFYSGMYANGGNYEDVYFKERYFNSVVEKQWHSYTDRHDAVELTDRHFTEFSSMLALELDTLQAQGVINPLALDWEAQGYSNIRVARNGYMIYIVPYDQLNQNAVNNRNAWTAGVCFVVNTPQHIGTINVCETPPLTRTA